MSHALLSADVSLQRHGPFAAPAFGVLRDVLPFATGTAATTVTVAYALRPTRFLTLHGWYRHPSVGDAAFEPPHHAVTMLTLRTRFLPHFRRGVFDLMGRWEMESWGEGVAGSDAVGQPIPLRGNTIFNAHVQFRLVGAIIYWTLRNPQLKHYNIVPGFDMPRSLQRWGIMWEFTN